VIASSAHETRYALSSIVGHRLSIAAASPLIGGLLVLTCIRLLQVIDGIVDGVTGLMARLGAGMRHVQTGYIRDYTLMFLLGVVLLIGYLVLR